MIQKADKDAWATIPVRRSVKDKYDEAARRTRFALNIVADEAIDAYLSSLDNSEKEPADQTAA